MSTSTRTVSKQCSAVGRRSVLCVDPDESYAVMLHDVWQQLQLADDLHIVRSQEEALAFLDAARSGNTLTAAIVLDPEATGEATGAFVRALRKRCGKKRVPIMFWSRDSQKYEVLEGRGIESVHRNSMAGRGVTSTRKPFFGYRAEEVLGRSVLGTIVPPVDSEGRDLHKMTEEITAYPEVHGSNDNENIRKDGSRVWIHWSNRALRDEQGAVREILCVGIDMTERRKLARRAESYRRRLQRLADRLTSTEEQERRRVASHIHDTVVQTLSLSNIRLGGVIAALEKAGMSDLCERVAGVRQLLDQGPAFVYGRTGLSAGAG